MTYAIGSVSADQHPNRPIRSSELLRRHIISLNVNRVFPRGHPIPAPESMDGTVADWQLVLVLKHMDYVNLITCQRIIVYIINKLSLYTQHGHWFLRSEERRVGKECR